VGFLHFIIWWRLQAALTSAAPRITPSAHSSFPTPRWLPWKAARRVCLPITASSQSEQIFPAALALADEVENLAAQYCRALALGNVRILDETEMRRVLEKFRTYGKQDATDSGLIFGGVVSRPGLDDGERQGALNVPDTRFEKPACAARRTHEDVRALLGNRMEDWQVREVGDGNLNLVFIVEGRDGSVCVKQALPYVRAPGRPGRCRLNGHFSRIPTTEP
jgi:hypothetical protein